MEITKSLQDDIVKIQHELITAIQNHQVLVLRQQVIPSESIKTQIEEVQRHIICLGESQKILVARLRNELESQSQQVKNTKHKTPLTSPYQHPLSKSDSEHDRFNKKLKSQDIGRSLLINNVNNRERSLLKTSYVSDSESVSDRKKIVLKLRHISVDSSSEENRTPCCSPINRNGENEQKGVKNSLPDSSIQTLLMKRPELLRLRVASRPNSPSPDTLKEHDFLSCFSEESLDSLKSQQPESETKKIDFALPLENEQKGLKRSLPDPPSQTPPVKRPMALCLRIASRPGSPSPDTNKEQNFVSCFSEQSLESLKLQKPESETKKIDIALPLVSDNEQKGVKDSLPDPPSQTLPVKRPKVLRLKFEPRPSSPVPVRIKEQDGLSSFSEESLDSLISQQPQSETKKIDFALALGLVTKEVYGRVIKKKSERRRRKSSVQQTLYNDQWDVTVLQKRSRLKDPSQDDEGEGEDGSRDCTTPPSDSDGLCFACLKPGELRECRVCHTGCHVTCVSNDICPACLQRAGLTPCNPLITEKRKELEQLKLVNKDLHKSVSKLRERAKMLSASLVMQTATVNQMSAKEDELLESIKKLKDFVSFMQSSPEQTT